VEDEDGRLEGTRGSLRLHLHWEKPTFSKRYKEPIVLDNGSNQVLSIHQCPEMRRNHYQCSPCETRIRKFASIASVFRMGYIGKQVRISYKDGAQYEGPFLHYDENRRDSIHSRDVVYNSYDPKEGDHWGRMDLGDQVFEGPFVDPYFDVSRAQGFHVVTDKETGEV
jgi:hypothetical protein